MKRKKSNKRNVEILVPLRTEDLDRIIVDLVAELTCNMRTRVDEDCPREVLRAWRKYSPIYVSDGAAGCRWRNARAKKNGTPLEKFDREQREAHRAVFDEGADLLARLLAYVPKKEVAA